jgi:pimeloyl-ACP methyl ester carboxylesterase
MSLQMAQNPHHLVLVPGLDGTGQLFEPFLGALYPDTDASVVSFPHDKAMYDFDLFAVIRNVIPWNRELVVVGESTSGPIALRFAAAQRENVRAVILVSSFVSNPILAAGNWATAFLTKPWYEKPVTAASVRKHLLGRRASEKLVNATVNALRTPWPEVLGHRIELMKKIDAREALRNWDKPILYLRGEEDQFISPTCLKEITSLNLAVKIVTIPGPHLLLQSNPREASEVIHEFLQKIAAPGSAPAPSPGAVPNPDSSTNAGASAEASPNANAA